MKLSFRGIGVVVAVLVALALAYGFWPKPLAVDVAAAARETLRVEIEEEGRARVHDRVVVSAAVTGSLARIALEPGDRVRRGQVLAEVRSVPLQPLEPRSRATAIARVGAARSGSDQARAAVGRVEAALSQARRDLVRMRALAAEGAVSRHELEQSETAVKLHEADLAAARQQVRLALQELEVARAALGAGARSSEVWRARSPIAGEVLRVLHADAGTVAAGTPLLELGDPRALEIVVDLRTEDAARVRPGMPAVVEAWGGDAALSARVRRVEPSAFTRVSPLGVEEQRVHVLLDLRAPPRTRTALGDGFAGTARITVWEGRNVLAIPSTALFRHGDGWAVYTAEAGVARVRPVTLGHRTALRAEVRAGLTAGERVIVHPPEALRAGAKVAPR